MKRQEQDTMTDLLRAALREADSLRAVERDTGVIRQSLMRFMEGTTSLRLDKADILADYFGIECRRRPQRKAGK